MRTGTRGSGHESRWLGPDAGAHRGPGADEPPLRIRPDPYELRSARGGRFLVAGREDVWETDQEIRFALEIPGLTMDRMDVRVEGDSLVVEGERPMERERPGEQYHRVEGSYGSFLRRFELPAAAERDGARATNRDGVLIIRLPKRPAVPTGSIRLEVR